MKIGILYNPASGTALSKAELKKLFKSSNELHFFDIRKGLPSVAKKIALLRIKTLVGSGGDGTINAAASLAVDHGLILGVIPAGTFNNFAKDMRLPLDAAEAVAVIESGSTTNVDYATVNNALFLNNSSIGAYPKAVVERDRLKLKKWIAAIIATLKVSKNLKSYKVRLECDDRTYSFKTPAVFIGNNFYDLEQTGLSRRESLTDAELSVIVLKSRRLARILVYAVRMLFGRRHPEVAFTTKTKSVVVTPLKNKRHVLVSTDGEVATMTYPLVYSVHPEGLKVLSNS